MPAPILKSLAAKSGKSMQMAEDKWDRAKQIANKNGQPNWALTTWLTKKMLNGKKK